MKKNAARTLIILLIIVMMPFPAFAVNEDYIPINIDGYYDDWEDKPHTEVYPGKNPPSSKINYVSLFRDEDYVYVHVIFAQKNNQGIKNMTIDFDTNIRDRSYFLFPDFWFNSNYMRAQEVIPEENPDLDILESIPEEEGATGTETDNRSITTEREGDTESADQNDVTESTDQDAGSEQNAGTEHENVPETTEITDEAPTINDQGETPDPIHNVNQNTDAEQTDENIFQNLYSNSNEDTYFVSNNGKGNPHWYGTWSFTVWRSMLNWDDWEDWDEWDDWEDWEDWDDFFDEDDLINWNDWFDWDEWASVGSGYYTRNESGADELELLIPLSSVSKKYDGITEISMIIKKLGPQSVVCTGVDSGAYVGIAAGAGIAILSVGAYAFKRKRPFFLTKEK